MPFIVGRASAIDGGVCPNPRLPAKQQLPRETPTPVASQISICLGTRHCDRTAHAAEHGPRDGTHLDPMTGDSRGKHTRHAHADRAPWLGLRHARAEIRPGLDIGRTPHWRWSASPLPAPDRVGGTVRRWRCATVPSIGRARKPKKILSSSCCIQLATRMLNSGGRYLGRFRGGRTLGRYIS